MYLKKKLDIYLKIYETSKFFMYLKIEIFNY